MQSNVAAASTQTDQAPAASWPMEWRNARPLSKAVGILSKETNNRSSVSAINKQNTKWDMRSQQRTKHVERGMTTNKRKLIRKREQGKAALRPAEEAGINASAVIIQKKKRAAIRGKEKPIQKSARKKQRPILRAWPHKKGEQKGNTSSKENRTRKEARVHRRRRSGQHKRRRSEGRSKTWRRETFPTTPEMQAHSLAGNGKK